MRKRPQDVREIDAVVRDLIKDLEAEGALIELGGQEDETASPSDRAIHAFRVGYSNAVRGSARKTAKVG